MKIAMGCDHYGFALKGRLKAWLEARGHEVLDCGGGAEADDRLMEYTDAVCRAVVTGDAERGIVVCMSGGFPLVRSNRWQGVRAVLGWHEEALAHDRAASDVNVLALSGKFLDGAVAEALVGVFLEVPFEPLPRRLMRLARLDEEIVV